MIGQSCAARLDLCAHGPVAGTCRSSRSKRALKQVRLCFRSGDTNDHETSCVRDPAIAIRLRVLRVLLHYQASGVASRQSIGCATGRQAALLLLTCAFFTAGGVQRRFLYVSARGKPTAVVRRVVSIRFWLPGGRRFPFPFSWRRSAAL